MDISKLRYDELLILWGEETNDPETQEWREELTIWEARLVESWDRAAYIGVRNLCERILELSPDLKWLYVCRSSRIIRF